MIFAQVKTRQPQPGQTVAYMYPMFGNDPPVLYWAQGGVICFEDRRTGKTGARGRRTMIGRLRAFEKMCITSSEDPRWQFETARAKKFIRAMGEVLAEAKRQGGPLADSPSVDATRPMPMPQVIDDDAGFARNGIVLPRVACNF